MLESCGEVSSGGDCKVDGGRCGHGDLRISMLVLPELEGVRKLAEGRCRLDH
jgi:hypothetical protein